MGFPNFVQDIVSGNIQHLHIGKYNVEQRQVIDKAVAPEKKSKPKRAMLILIAGVGGFFLACISAFVLEAIHKSQADQKSRDRWAALIGAWKNK